MDHAQYHLDGGVGNFSVALWSEYSECTDGPGIKLSHSDPGQAQEDPHWGEVRLADMPRRVSTSQNLP